MYNTSSENYEMLLWEIKGDVHNVHGWDGSPDS